MHVTKSMNRGYQFFHKDPCPALGIPDMKKNYTQCEKMEDKITIYSFAQMIVLGEFYKGMLIVIM